MPILVLSARHTDDSQKLWRACIAAGWEVQRVNGWKVPEVRAAEVAVYGEPLMATHVAQSLGLHLIEPPLDWLPQLPGRWRGREVRLMTLAEARQIDERAFIKPADEKCFDARVYQNGGELPLPGPLPDNLPVLVQDVVKWTVEYRCFVVARTIATASAYWRHGALPKSSDGIWTVIEEELREAIRFCQSVLDDPEVVLPEAVVVDIGIIENQAWAVVECNAAWASGTYGCDPIKILRVLKEACRPR
jgi:hypothetical protein